MERGLAMACGGLGEGGPGPVFVHEQQLLVRVQPADVLCIQQHDKYCQLWLDPNRCHTVRRSLAQLLEQLPAAFAQVHRAWAVHLRHIQAVAPAAGFVYLSHEMRVPVGRSYRRQLRQCLMLPGQAAD
jgi:DNA-binding LytR/AlgR family response regulator